MALASRQRRCPRDPLARVRRGGGRVDGPLRDAERARGTSDDVAPSSRRRRGSSSRPWPRRRGWELALDDGVAIWTGGRIEGTDVVSFPLEVTARTAARERDLPCRPALRRRRGRALGGVADRRPGRGRRRAVAAARARRRRRRGGPRACLVVAASLVTGRGCPRGETLQHRDSGIGCYGRARALRPDPERRPGMRLVSRRAARWPARSPSSIHTSRSSRSSPRPSGSTSASCGRSRRTRTPTTSPATAASRSITASR